jgi:hypothetical protein
MAALGCTSLDGLKRRGPKATTECAPLAKPPQYSPLPGNAGAEEFTVVVSRQNMGEGSDPNLRDYREIGYDLDGTCTADGADRSCIRPRWATANDDDGPHGRDNMGGLLCVGLWDDGWSVTQYVNENISAGLATTAIRVTGYNGSAADNQVEVSVYAATTIQATTPLELCAQQSATRPIWNGRDEWRAFGEWAAPSAGAGQEFPIVPTYRTVDAYVSGDYLVARFDKLLTAIGEFSGVVITARIVSDPQTGLRALEGGVFAGRYGIAAVPKLLAATADSASSERKLLCTDSPNYVLYKSRTCAATDIAYSARDDRATECDAISWAWEFEAKPARLVGVVPSSESCAIKNACGPGLSPADDRCDTLD